MSKVSEVRRMEEKKKIEWVRQEIRRTKAAGLSIKQMDPDALRLLKIKLLQIYWINKKREERLLQMKNFTFGFCMAVLTAITIMAAPK